ncbi:hypothetical protein U1Q18_010999 [Sarracenia purpurea var. burkii]
MGEITVGNRREREREGERAHRKAGRTREKLPMVMEVGGYRWFIEKDERESMWWCAVIGGGRCRRRRRLTAARDTGEMRHGCAQAMVEAEG